MDAILEQLNRVRGVGGSIVMNPDGLTMASLLRDGVEEEAIAAILADVIDRSNRMCEGVGVGSAGMISVQGKDGALVIRSAGDNYLAILVDPSANLALLDLETRPIVEALKQQLSL